jgi:hypothetical protein
MDRGGGGEAARGAGKAASALGAGTVESDAEGDCKAGGPLAGGGDEPGPPTHVARPAYWGVGYGHDGGWPLARPTWEGAKTPAEVF